MLARTSRSGLGCGGRSGRERGVAETIARSRAPNGRARVQGFTYLMVLAAIVSLGIMADASTRLISMRMQREAEKELMFRGQSYVAAIRSYYEAGKTVKTLPQNIEDLILDPRYAHKRHLRALYPDPITGGKWNVIRDGAGGIRGVVSRSHRVPLRQGNFPPGLESFQQMTRYTDWRFEFEPEAKKPRGKLESVSRDRINLP